MIVGACGRGVGGIGIVVSCSDLEWRWGLKESEERVGSTKACVYISDENTHYDVDPSAGELICVGYVRSWVERAGN